MNLVCTYLENQILLTDLRFRFSAFTICQIDHMKLPSDKNDISIVLLLLPFLLHFSYLCTVGKMKPPTTLNFSERKFTNIVLNGRHYGHDHVQFSYVGIFRIWLITEELWKRMRICAIFQSVKSLITHYVLCKKSDS